MAKCSIDRDILRSEYRDYSLSYNTHSIFLTSRWKNLNKLMNTFLNDYLNILSENYSCMTTKPPELWKS